MGKEQERTTDHRHTVLHDHSPAFAVRVHLSSFGEMVKFSFYKMKYATPVDKRQFVGFRNYIDVFKKDECFSALKLSLYYMAGAMVQLVLALYLATILSFKTKFGNMFKGFMFFPYLISGIAIGFIFKFFYTRGFVFDTVLQWCGFNLEVFRSG